MSTFARRSRTLAIIALGTAAVCVGRAGAGDSTVPDVARGRHIATALAGCTDCHGAALAGGRTFTRGGVTVAASNLTPGAGGIAALSDADVQRAIRDGVRPDGTPLLVMPWREYAPMTDADVAALIAYLRTLPPVDDVVPGRSPAPGATPAGTVSPPPAGDGDPASAPPAALSAGAYLATIGGCLNCHGANLTGTIRPNGSVSPNITRSGIGTWSFADFQTAMRSGRTPAGRTLSYEMPWRTIGRMTDAELRTLYEYLQAQPADANERRR